MKVSKVGQIRLSNAEVPILVNRLLQGSDYRITPERREETDAFMSWIRENSIRHQKKIRIVMTGSIGFEPILHLAGLNATLNTFTSLPLSEWSSKVATDFIREAAKEYGLVLRDGAEEQVVSCLGYCIPHYVQVFFDRVYRHSRLRGITEVTPAIVHEVYRDEMLSLQGHAELSHLEERLKVVLGPSLFPFALELLTEAAVTGSLSPEAANIIAAGYTSLVNSIDNDLRNILGILEHDGYLNRTSAKGYTFTSKLVRDWWKARFEFNYKPALARMVGSK